MITRGEISLLRYLTVQVHPIAVCKMTIETKLGYPFNYCWNRKNLPDTPLVRKLSEANITYRQANCFELCFQNFVENYALEQKIS